MISFASNYRGGSSLVRIGAIVERTGLHENTIRNYADSGQIRSYRTLGGHRVFSEKEVLKDLGWCDEREEEEERRPVIYARVSSKTQEKEGNLSRQIDRLQKHIKDEQGEEGAIVIKDIASAFGERPGLNRLVDMILENRVSKIFCEYQDRLSRVPAVSRLLEHICQRFGVELVYIENTIDEQEKNELVSELLDFLTVVCNRISAKKSANNTRRILSDEAVREAYRRKQEGEGLSSIAQDFIKRKVKDQRGRPFDEYHFLHQALRRHIEMNRPVLEKLFGPIKDRVSMVGFLKKYVKKDEEGGTITVDDIFEHWKRLCKRIGQPELDLKQANGGW